MKFIVTTCEMDGINNIYSLETNKFLEFPTFKYKEPKTFKLKNVWRMLPLEISINICCYLLDNCMLDTSFVLVNKYVFISKTIFQKFCLKWMNVIQPSPKFLKGISGVIRTVFFTSQIVDILFSEGIRLVQENYYIQFSMNNFHKAELNAGPWDLEKLIGLKKIMISQRSFNYNDADREPITLFSGGRYMKDSFAIRGEYNNGVFDGELLRPIIIINVVSKSGLTIFNTDFCRSRWYVLSNMLKRLFGPFTRVLMICNDYHENPFVIKSVLIPF